MFAMAPASSCPAIGCSASQGLMGWVVDTPTLFLRDPWPCLPLRRPHCMLPWIPERADQGPPQERRGWAMGNQGQKRISPKA